MLKIRTTHPSRFLRIIMLLVCPQIQFAFDAILVFIYLRLCVRNVLRQKKDRFCTFLRREHVGIIDSNHIREHVGKCRSKK